MKRYSQAERLTSGKVSCKETAIFRYAKSCVTEVPLSVLIEQIHGYTMGKETKRENKITHSLFFDDLKFYQDSHQELKL